MIDGKRWPIMMTVVVAAGSEAEFADALNDFADMAKIMAGSTGGTTGASKEGAWEWESLGVHVPGDEAMKRHVPMPPVTLVVTDGAVEMFFDARSMCQRPPLEPVGPYRRFGAIIRLPGKAHAAAEQDQAVKTLMRCARSTVRVLETNEITGETEPVNIAAQVEPGSWLCQIHPGDL